VVDEVFFRGAANYIATLEAKDQPWMLTLLTVGTHQPYAVPDAIAAQLDRNLTVTVPGQRVLQFASGELRRLSAKASNDWADNLTGAQYLDFPAGSEVKVTVRVKAMKAPPSGVYLRLLAKQWEYDQADIPIPEFPALRTGEECQVEFSFTNPEARQSFSFYLLGEGKNALIRMDEFTITVTDPSQSS